VSRRVLGNTSAYGVGLPLSENPPPDPEFCLGRSAWGAGVWSGVFFFFFFFFCRFFFFASEHPCQQSCWRRCS
jgi:hypothetical protein